MPTETRMNLNDPLDFDDLLNVEDQYYQEGYKEGQLEGIKMQFKEGKELGIQTGFQRFLIIGQFRSFVKIALREIDRKLEKGETTTSTTNNSSTSTKETNNKIVHHISGGLNHGRDLNKIKKQFENVYQVLDTLFENNRLRITNSDSDVEKYEKVLKASRAKVRSLSGFIGLSDLFQSIEPVCQEVGLNIPQAGLTGADTDMW